MTQPDWIRSVSSWLYQNGVSRHQHKGCGRSHDFLVAPALNICPQCKQAIPPHKVCDLVEECGNVQRSKTHNPMAKKEKEKPKK